MTKYLTFLEKSNIIDTESRSVTAQVGVGAENYCKSPVKLPKIIQVL